LATDIEAAPVTNNNTAATVAALVLGILMLVLPDAYGKGLWAFFRILASIIAGREIRIRALFAAVLSRRAGVI
jgi:hypothetical protein